MSRLAELENKLAELTADIAQLSQLAKEERQFRKTRQAEGIAAAKKSGVRFGRPTVNVPSNFGEMVSKWENGELNLCELLHNLNMKESTFYRRLREYRKNAKKFHHKV